MSYETKFEKKLYYSSSKMLFFHLTTLFFGLINIPRKTRLNIRNFNLK
jgi:hypothetical protein